MGKGHLWTTFPPRSQSGNQEMLKRLGTLKLNSHIPEPSVCLSSAPLPCPSLGPDTSPTPPLLALPY